MNHAHKVVYGGKLLKDASKVLVMVHGRGASASDILSLAPYLDIKDFALVAPQATNNTWYPYSFMAPESENQPWLSSALILLDSVVVDLRQKGFEDKDIYFLGFSQGACLTLEFVAQHAAAFGGVIAFTGGVIGEQIDESKYQGDFDGTPVFISTGDPDPHVPVQRVLDTEKILKKLHADVQVKIYSGRPHTITQEELTLAKQFVLDKVKA